MSYLGALIKHLKHLLNYYPYAYKFMRCDQCEECCDEGNGVMPCTPETCFYIPMVRVR